MIRTIGMLATFESEGGGKGRRRKVTWVEPGLGRALERICQDLVVLGLTL